MLNPQPRGTVCLNWARTDLWGASLDLRVKRPYPGFSSGRLVRRLHDEVGAVTRLNVTPWIRFGRENEIHIVRDSPGSGAINRVGIDIHQPGTCP